MHIPDGILDAKVWTSTAVAAGVVLAGSVRHAQKSLDKKAVPLMGGMAAFIFAAQMVNFPLLGAAASGHLIGGALAAILFGFWPATLIMSTVVAIQALLFQDGGITVLGTNILNMAILAPAAAALIHRLLRRLAVPASARCFLSAWFSVAAVALAGAFELALSGVVPFLLAAKVLLFWHALIGIGEGLITAVVIPFAERSSFELLSEKGKVAE